MKNCLRKRSSILPTKMKAILVRPSLLCLHIGHADGFFLRLQLIYVNGLVSERTLHRADQLEGHHVRAFCAPWKVLTFADCHRVRKAMTRVDDAVNSTLGN